MRPGPVLLSLCVIAVGVAHAQQPVCLAPRFRAGQTLRYFFDFRLEREGGVAGAIEDPQGARKQKVNVGAVVRIDVLRAGADPSGPGERYRLRGTYERLILDSRADVLDPQAAADEAEFRRLEGRAVEFTQDAEGKVSDITGLEGILPAQAGSAADWLAGLGLGTGMPPRGVVPGRTWSAGEKVLAAAPLAGVVWRGESTYLRDEPCRPSILTPAGTLQPAPGSLTCAVILTRFTILQRDAPRDPTPEDFRRRGLRTAGTISGAGESLAYVARTTGWLVSVTQTATEEIDLRVTVRKTGAEVRYTGRVRSQSSTTLLADPPSGR